MLFAVSVGMLGYTRIQSVVCYNSDTRAFDELTPAIAKRGIEAGQVKGVLCRNTEDGIEFVPDVEGFNKQNIMVKTAAAKFRPLLGDLPGLPVNSMYNVVRVLHTDYRGTLYEIVSNRYDRIKVNEKQLRQLNDISPVAGVWISDNEIKIASGIKVEDRTGKKLSEETEPENSLVEQENIEIKEDGITEEPVETTEEPTEEPVEKAEEPTESEPLRMEAVFGDTSEMGITDEQNDKSFSVESGTGGNVTKKEEKEVGNKPVNRGKKRK